MQDFYTWLESMAMARAMRGQWYKSKEPPPIQGMEIEQVPTDQYQKQRRQALLDDPERLTPPLAAFDPEFYGHWDPEYKGFSGQAARDAWLQNIKANQPPLKPVFKQMVTPIRVFRAVLDPTELPGLDPEKIEKYILMQGTPEQKALLELAYLVQRSFKPKGITLFLKLAETQPELVKQAAQITTTDAIRQWLKPWIDREKAAAA